MLLYLLTTLAVLYGLGNYYMWCCVIYSPDKPNQDYWSASFRRRLDFCYMSVVFLLFGSIILLLGLFDYAIQTFRRWRWYWQDVTNDSVEYALAKRRLYNYESPFKPGDWQELAQYMSDNDIPEVSGDMKSRLPEPSVEGEV